eukprot:360318-Chlamydomonas_euryale.AAC.3
MASIRAREIERLAQVSHVPFCPQPAALDLKPYNVVSICGFSLHLCLDPSSNLECVVLLRCRVVCDEPCNGVLGLARTKNASASAVCPVVVIPDRSISSAQSSGHEAAHATDARAPSPLPPPLPGAQLLTDARSEQFKTASALLCAEGAAATSASELARSRQRCAQLEATARSAEADADRAERAREAAERCATAVAGRAVDAEQSARGASGDAESNRRQLIQVRGMAVRIGLGSDRGRQGEAIGCTGVKGGRWLAMRSAHRRQLIEAQTIERRPAAPRMVKG